MVEWVQAEGGGVTQDVVLFQVEQSSMDRMRFIYLAKPTEEVPPEIPKSVPDEESHQALWIKPEALLVEPIKGHLRGPEPSSWYSYVSNNGPSYSLSLVKSVERDPSSLSEEEKKIKKEAAEMRKPHLTISEVEVVTYNPKLDSYLVGPGSSFYKFPTFSKWNRGISTLVEAAIVLMQEAGNFYFWATCGVSLKKQ
eukprot:TRINITY_DN684_c0_g1_i1.p1 TRINITY_DN684_c0_g1~~TRINITY_DN684_c0_g1_i1.p1  ORF type:complete len:196 (-),score=48.54 TRINITY_DN684_c0_g1_i1:475-1062(-)